MIAKNFRSWPGGERNFQFSLLLHNFSLHRRAQSSKNWKLEVISNYPFFSGRVNHNLGQSLIQVFPWKCTQHHMKICGNFTRNFFSTLPRGEKYIRVSSYCGHRQRNCEWGCFSGQPSHSSPHPKTCSLKGPKVVSSKNFLSLLKSQMHCWQSCLSYVRLYHC